MYVRIRLCMRMLRMWVHLLRIAILLQDDYTPWGRVLFRLFEFFFSLRSAQNQRGIPPGHGKERNMSLLLKVTFAEQNAIREDLEEIDLNFIF